jgi:cytochrome c oxidase subunit 1
MSATNSAAGYRICPATHLRVYHKAESLIKANAVVAVVALLVGAIAALLLVLTRWQAVHLLPAE